MWRPPAPPPSAAPPAAGRGGPGGGQGGPRAPRNAAFDGFCWGIDQWDAKKVEAELKKRGLTPVADNHGDFQSFHVKDPDGFDLQISNGNRKNRRQGPAAGKTSAPAPFEATGWQTRVARSHLVRGDELQGNRRVLPRAPRLEARAGRGQPEHVRHRRHRRHHHPPAARRGAVRRAPAPRARASVTSRSASPVRSRQGEGRARQARTQRARGHGRPRRHPHRDAYKSYHTTTPNGFDLQISATTKSTRDVA